MDRSIEDHFCGFLIAGPDQVFSAVGITGISPLRQRKILDAILDVAMENGNVIDTRIQGLVYCLLEELRLAPEESVHRKISFTPPYAHELLLYLQRHIHDKVTLADLAEITNLSESHLSRIFLQTYHVSPINYLIYSRMRRARTYILEEDLPSAEIARRLAYKTTWQFSQAFRKFFGCAPEEYHTYAIRENM